MGVYGEDDATYAAIREIVFGPDGESSVLEYEESFAGIYAFGREEQTGGKNFGHRLITTAYRGERHGAATHDDVMKALNIIGDVMRAGNGSPVLDQDGKPRAEVIDLMNRTALNTKALAHFMTIMRRSGQSAGQQIAGQAIDPLSTLPKRETVLGKGKMAERYLAAAAKAGVPVSFVFVDLDGFGALNDDVGYELGDAAISSTGQLIEAIACPEQRAIIDGHAEPNAAGEIADPPVMAARIGGDEFLIIVKGDIDAANAVASKVVAAISGNKGAPGAPHPALTASAGVIEVSKTEGVQDALKRASQAMRTAKAAGGNQVHLGLAMEADRSADMGLVTDRPKPPS